jgi:hypothetical protein
MKKYYIEIIRHGITYTRREVIEAEYTTSEHRVTKFWKSEPQTSLVAQVPNSLLFIHKIEEINDKDSNH